MAKKDQPRAVQPRNRRWIFGGTFAWLVTAVVINEFVEPPFDPVRFLLRLVLAGLMAWFFAWLFTRFRRPGN